MQRNEGSVTAQKVSPDTGHLGVSTSISRSNSEGLCCLKLQFCCDKETRLKSFNEYSRIYAKKSCQCMKVPKLEVIQSR